MPNTNCHYCTSCTSCKSCNYCTSCTSCNSCNYCTSCTSCKSCNYCTSCNTCDSCNSCDSCNYCTSCNTCDSCTSCKSCTSCTSCTSCKSCTSCTSCNTCDSCNSCDSCDYCTSCNSCNYCYSCDYSKNLKMTEYNLFCTAEDKNRDWFQRPRYQVFNTQITEEEYGEIKIPNHKLEFNNNESYKTRFQTAFKKMWATLTEEQKQEYFNIPHFNWAIFADITGVEKIEDKYVVWEDGKKYRLVPVE